MANVTAAQITAEFVGTFLLVFTIGCNVLSKTPVWAGVSIACVLMVSIYALGGISGGNFNPAVSISIATSTALKGPGEMDWKKCGIYCATQILAGIVAAFSYAIMFWNAFDLGPSKGFGMMSAGLCEFFYTFMLCFVVLNVAVSRRYDSPLKGGFGPNEFYGLAIGFVIVAGAYGAGVVSGGCFNPAVAIGIDTSSAGLGFGYCIPYVIFEVLGGVCATFAYKAIRPDDFLGHDSAGKIPSSFGAKLACEFLGTFMLVLTVGLNVLGNSPAGAFSIAASLMCMIYALGPISGAHFNPAVTLAIHLSEMEKSEDRKTLKEVGLYMLVQIAGAVCASEIYTIIFLGHSFPLGPQAGYNWIHAGVAEAIFTFVLCFVVLCTAVSDNTKSSQMFGLAIGSCVTVGGFAIGGVSGASLNPAVSIGIGCAHSQIMKGGLSSALAYSCYEFGGAAIAAGIARATHGTAAQQASKAGMC